MVRVGLPEPIACTLTAPWNLPPTERTGCGCILSANDSTFRARTRPGGARQNYREASRAEQGLGHAGAGGASTDGRKPPPRLRKPSPGNDRRDQLVAVTARYALPLTPTSVAMK